ncbi:ABC transporter ATP-binding protein [Rhodovulum sp. DZ06]|uniref:ABC transporter ATP-binding protein n=1 Tax=Rhodovulum sp. DZ06 TaxID=3425126 RepID=UPI003D349A98
MSDLVLRLSGIARTYGSGPAAVEVLKGCDLQVAAGEVVAMTAPSGSGKSTLLHIAGLLDKPDAGTVEVVGHDMTAERSDAVRTAMRRREIGFVYQFHHLMQEFTAAENVAIPQLAEGASMAAATARAGELLEAMGLSGRATHRPAELSGGEQQRVAIARALANGPRLLLADEPTGNLDPETSEKVFAALRAALAEAGAGALIATHNLELAARMDRQVRLEGGALV